MKAFLFSLPAALLFCSCSPEASQVDEAASSIPRIIFDTDLGGDIDDLGALYALHVYADRGLCTIAAVMTSWSMAFHVDGIDAVNHYFGRGDIPVGAYIEPFFEKEEYTWFLGETYPHTRTGRSAPKSPDLYREVLAASDDRSITIVVTGRLNNLYHLFQSEADEHSPLSGIELVEQKVDRLFIMGGRYVDLDKPEANFRYGGPGVSKFVIDHCPRPIVFNGAEIGGKEYGYGTGSRINELPDDHIMKAGYGYFFKNPPDWTGMTPSDTIGEWSIWDVITVQLACTGPQDYFEVVDYGYNSMDESGKNTWSTEIDKDHSYVLPKMDPQTYADEVIEPLFLVDPAIRSRG